nr:putative transposase (putative), gypsy type [Tanacetum cinerariifolium]
MGRDTVQLKTAINTISYEYLLEFTSEYGIPETLHPKLPGPEDRIIDFPKGKVGVYTRFFEFANFRFTISQFLFDVLGWMSFSKRSGKNTPQCYTKPLDSLKNWNNRFFWVDKRVFPTVVDWRTNAPKDGMPAESTYSIEAVRALDTHHMELFNLIRALNPTKVKTGSRPRAPHEVPLLTLTATRVIEMDDPAAATDSSGVPSTIERSSLDFALEARASDQGTVALEMPPFEDVPAIDAPMAGHAEEAAATDPPVARESRKRGSSDGGKSIAAIQLGLVCTVSVPEDALTGVSDLDPLSFADPPSRPPADVAQSSQGTAAVGDPESENASFPAEVGSSESVYRPEWGVTNGSLLDTPKACQDLVDHAAPPGYFSELCHMHNEEFLMQYNVNLARQVAMGSQLRLMFEQEAKLLRKSVAQVATLQEQVIGEEKLKAAFEEFKRYEDNRVERRCTELDARLDALSMDFDEELYPHMLTAITGRRWVIGHGPSLAVMKCGESLEMRQAFVDVVSTGIAKGMSEGLRHGVEQGQAQLNVESIEAYDPKAESKFVAALQVLKDLKYPWVDQLEGLKDAPIDLTIPLYPEVRDPQNPWAYKEEMTLVDAIAANISRVKKKKKCHIVRRTHGVGSAHHARSDGVLVSVPTVVPQGLALLLQTRPHRLNLRILR